MTFCRMCGRKSTQRICAMCIDVVDDHREPPEERLCGQCGKEVTQVFHCIGCKEEVTMTGTWVWYWQGYGHYIHLSAEDEGYLLEHMIDAHGVWVPLDSSINDA